MGTSFAPYVNLFMGWWENEVAWREDNSVYMEKVMLWCRFIDDLFILFEGEIS